MSDITVEPETGEVTVLMTAEEAEEKTLKAQSYMGMVCVLVKELHDKQAWRALGYPSWTAYCKDRFNVGKSRSYQLIGYAETIALGTRATGLPESTIVDSLPEGVARGIDRDDLAALLEDAYANLPSDTTIATRGDLFRALIEQITSGEEEEARPDPTGSDAWKAGASKANAATDAAADDEDEDDEQQDDAAEVPDAAESSTGASGEPGQVPAPDPAPTTPSETPVDGPPSDVDAGSDSDEAAGDSAHGLDAGAGGAGPAASTPTLPDDWAARLANVTHLLGCPADLLAAVASDDDNWDLLALASWLTDYRAARNAIKEQNT